MNTGKTPQIGHKPRGTPFEIIAPFSLVARGANPYLNGVYKQLWQIRKLSIMMDYLGDIRFSISVDNKINAIAKARSSLELKMEFGALVANTSQEFIRLHSVSISRHLNQQKPSVNRNQAFQDEIDGACLFEAYNKYMTAMHLATIGGFHAKAPMLFINGRFAKIGQSFSGGFLNETVGFAREQGLPSLRMIGFYKVWKWCNSFSGFNHEFSDNRVSRALNIFTYAICDSHNSQNIGLLYWLLMALEAIYVDSAEGIGYQLRERAASYLGKELVNVKLLNKMYSTRSRLIHGDLNVPTAFGERDAEDKYFKYDIEVYDSAMYAAYLLISTFHKMIKENRKELYFHYSVV